MRITLQQVQQYQEQGFCVLPHVIPQDHLTNLRDECARWIDAIHAEMDAKGSDTLGISHRIRRVYLAQYSSEPLRRTNDGSLWGWALPFLQDGRKVAAVAA